MSNLIIKNQSDHNIILAGCTQPLVTKFYRLCACTATLKERAIANKNTGFLNGIMKTANRLLTRDYLPMVGEEVQTAMKNYMSSLFHDVLVGVDEDEIEIDEDKEYVIPLTIPENSTKEDQDSQVVEEPKSYNRVNVILPRGASLLMIMLKDKWMLPGGFTKAGENVYSSSIRFIRDQCGLYPTVENLDIISSYESNDTNREDRYMISDIMCVHKSKSSPTTGSGIQKAEFIPFDKLLSDTDVYEDHIKTIREFILK